MPECNPAMRRGELLWRSPRTLECRKLANSFRRTASGLISAECPSWRAKQKKINKTAHIKILDNKEGIDFILDNESHHFVMPFQRRCLNILF